MNCSPPGPSVHGISQARILEWVAISSSQRNFLTQGLNPHLLHWQMDSYHWATRKARVPWIQFYKWRNWGFSEPHLGMSYDQTAGNQGSGDGTLYIPAPCPELLLSSLFTRCNLGAPGCPRGFYKSSPLVPTDLLTLDSSGSPIFSADKVVTGLIVHPAMLTTESSGNAPSRQREVAASFPNQATLVRTGREKRKGSNIPEAICSAGWFSLFIFHWQSF